jgi:HSP20 family protein
LFTQAERQGEGGRPAQPVANVANMPPQRDLFANFARMRREMDELFGDVLGRTGLAPRRAGFSPSVDVYYCDQPPRAVITAEVAGVDPDSLSLEVHGREVVLSGRRRTAEAGGRVYQQLEIEHGPFRRSVSLGADVRAQDARAVYENGILRVELPLAEPSSRSRSVPIEVPDQPVVSEESSE